MSFAKLQPWALSACVAVLMSVGFFGLNAIPSGLDISPIRYHITSSFENHYHETAQRKSWYLDCLIMAMAADPNSNGISPLNLWDLKHGGDDLCVGAREIALGHRLDPAAFYQEPYQQYWWGNRAVLTIALRYLDVVQTERLGDWLVYGAGIAALLAHLLAAFRRPQLKHVHIAVSLVCLGMLLFWDLPAAASSFRSLPNNILLFVFIGLSALIPATGLSISRQALIFSCFGSITVYFDLFDGPIPLGMAGIFLAMMLAHPDSTVRAYITDSIRAISFYCTGVLITALMKFAGVLVFVDHQFVRHYLDLLLYRVNGSARVLVAPQIRAINHGLHVTIPGAVVELLTQIYVLGFGSHGLGLAVAIVTTVIYCAGPIALCRSAIVRFHLPMAALLLSGLPIITWDLLFLQHTYVMVINDIREFAWFVSCAMGVVYLFRAERTAGVRELASRRGESATLTGPRATAAIPVFPGDSSSA